MPSSHMYDAREQDVRSVMFADIMRTIEHYAQTFPEYIIAPSTEQYKFLDGWLRVVTGEKQPEVVYLQRVGGEFIDEEKLRHLASSGDSIKTS